MRHMMLVCFVCLCVVGCERSAVAGVFRNRVTAAAHWAGVRAIRFIAPRCRGACRRACEQPPIQAPERPIPQILPYPPGWKAAAPMSAREPR